MSRLEQRPYAGTWKLNSHEVTQQVPDMLVFVNGHNNLPGCNTCHERLDIHKFITQVSVDASTSPNGMTGSLNLSVPPFESQYLFPNGEAVLKRGLEIHIYGRGFFPQEGIHASTGDRTSTWGSATGGGGDLGDLRYSSVGNATKRPGRPTTYGFPVSAIKDKQGKIWALKGAEMKAAYPRERLLAIVEAAAKHYNLDPKLLWGNLLVESGGNPIGPNTEKTAGAAAKGDTGFGMAQTNLTQWTEIKNKDRKGEIWWDHADLYDPQKAIWTAAFLMSKYGVKTSLEARALWAGSKSKYQGSPKVIASAKKIDAVPSSLFQRKHAGQPGDDQFPQQTIPAKEGSTEPGGEELPAETQPSELLRQVVDYPYYQVFHGVVTGSSWDESGGTRTGSLTIAGMMHFWENQYIVQQGSIFGANPKGNANTHNYTQHNYTGMTPHAIMWTLHKDVSGAAPSVSWALNQRTNIAAENTTFDQSQYKMARLFWEKRFAQSPTPLRMYGVDGSLYSHAQQAFLAKVGSGMGGSNRTQNIINKKASDTPSKANEPLKTTPGSTPPTAPNKAAVASAASGKAVATPAAKTTKPSTSAPTGTAKGDPEASVKFPPIDTAMASLVQFNPESQRFAHQGSFKLNAAQLQAFHLDLSQWGTVNLFEATYQTKLEVANQVCEITGFEFYQDMDGDFVFKPPFYNLDTRESPVYCLLAKHLISFSESEQEPTATYVTCTGSQFENLGGTGLEGEFGLKSTYVDWRLVSQFGWRESSFTSAAYSTTTAAFYAAVNRLDILNAPSRSASASIPFRPEIRPGYPVWVEHLDCFYYVTGVQHSFQYGSDATTSLTLTAKRARWSAPGRTNQKGIEAVDLSNPYLPARPLTVADGEGEVRQVGFPNVVMTLDPAAQNPFSKGTDVTRFDLTKPDDIRSLVKLARVLNLLAIADKGNQSESERWENGPWKLQSGPNQSVVFDLQDLLLDESNKPVIRAKGKKAVSESKPVTELGLVLQDLVDQVTSGRDLKTLTEGYTLNLLADRKASFGSAHQPGLYRYYSCSHPDPGQQGHTPLTRPTPVEGFLRHPEGEGEAQLGGVMATRGIWVDDQSGSIPTDLIQTVVLTSSAHSYTTAEQVNQGAVGSLDIQALHLALRGWFRLDRLPAYTTESVVAVVLQDLWKPFLTASVSVGGVEQMEFPKFGVLGSQTVDNINTKTGQPAAQWLKDMLEQLTLWAVQDVSGQFQVQQTYQHQVGDTKAIAKANTKAQAAALKKASAWLATFLKTINVSVPVIVQPAKSKIARGYTVPKMTTIFPVSDSGGYEVVGSYRYGRGVSIEPFGTFDQVLQTDPLHYADPKDVEVLLSKVMRAPAKGSAKGSIRFKSASDEDLAFAARLASQSLQVPHEIERIRKLSPSAKETLKAKLENWASSALDGIDSISPANVGYSLAQIQPEPPGRGCTCAISGARNALDLLDPEGFVAVDRNVPKYLAQRYRDQEQATAERRDLLTKERR